MVIEENYSSVENSKRLTKREKKNSIRFIQMHRCDWYLFIYLFTFCPFNACKNKTKQKVNKNRTKLRKQTNNMYEDNEVGWQRKP